ncbi:MerC domain-containing protein [Glaciecola sp. MH2013]|uniref:MerC domain-containing protein n=1 Tax=Glaciecola sp. MH2013 TaxID=2785524 RepID=UPI0018A0CE7D|nr:MerC domain-containing protein [Glaciecola sp. MH2013]MBF7071805.1 MerC domain-containing protein [Glaciecola sp. MH2013]
MNSKVADIKPQVIDNNLNDNEVSQVEADKKTSNVILDKLGIWVSSLCALHCLLIPLLLPIAPLVASSIFAEQWFERSILSFSILVGFAALFVGFHKYHRQLYPLYSLALGGLIYWNKDIFGHEFEPFTIAVGAFLIIVAHVTNLRLCKSCQNCESDCHTKK